MSHAIDIEEDPRIIKDREDLQAAVSEAGLLAYGVLLVELWVFDSTRLHRVAHWLDPMFHNKEEHEDCPLCRLTEPSRPGFVAPSPLVPGEGLPGVLWRDANMTSTMLHSARSASSRTANSRLEPSFTRRRIAWRQVESVARDPDQPWNPRLQLLNECGLGWAAAVSFPRGIVLYMARNSVDTARLKDVTNENYLVASAHLIDAIYSVQEPRLQALASRRLETMAGFKFIKHRIKILVDRSKSELEKAMSQSPEPACPSTAESPVNGLCSPCYHGTIGATQKLKAAVAKTSGANMQPPPPMSWQESAFTAVAAGITLYAVTQVSRHLEETYGKEYRIVLGPFGALMTLLYGLSAAPASQPRNTIIGQLLSLAIAIGIGSVDSLATAIKQTLAVALSIGVMVKFGLTHPPAGAAALLFAPGVFRWSHMLSMVIGNVVAIGLATAFNNLSSRRQYPSYWSLVQIPSVFKGRKGESSEPSTER